MLYQHSLEIQERLESVLRLIETGQYSTPALAKEVGVSAPTVSRIIAALRERGHVIIPKNKGNGWGYVLVEKAGTRMQRGEESREGTWMATPEGRCN
jgi:Mn-dependent DtxR family transcriptional regulator